MSWVYIVQCRDGSYYTGYAENLEHRLQAHNDGKGAKYTRSRRPVRLVYCEEHPTKQEAMSREWHIKHLTRKQKEQLFQ